MPSLIIKELSNKGEVKEEVKVNKEINKSLKRISRYI
jgi:hypothetical protein